MNPIHLGVPVLRRYDLLQELLLSVKSSTVRPVRIVVIDNGRNAGALERVARAVELSIPEVYTPEVPLGVAESWNWLVQALPEDRIIANDDVTFTPDAIEKMRDTRADLVFGHGYSCFLIRDSAIEKLGFFDEGISPGYAYWEDIDYDMRARLAVADGVDFVQANAPCTVNHGGSKTNEIATPDEIQDYHRKFMLAQRNFINKWARLPAHMRHPAIGGAR